MKTLTLLLTILLAAVTLTAQEKETLKVITQDEIDADDPTFTMVEEMPSFPGGEEELFKFLAENLKYPNTAKDAGISGIVYVNFIVDSSGEVRDAKILRGIGAGCDEEVLRIVELMPDWEPGRQRGKAVHVSYNLPIRFKLAGDDEKKKKKGKKKKN